MPVRILTEVERQRWTQFPTQIAPDDVIRCFTLSATDIAEVAKQRGDANRLGFALQLGALRYLGFAPDDLTAAPSDVVSYVAHQLDVTPQALEAYGHRAQTRTEHLQQVQRYLGFRKVTAAHLETLEAWLVERALEHDKPSLLLQLTCEHLHRERLVRPGVTRLERLVAMARERAHQETFLRLAPLLTAEHTAWLDQLLMPDASRGRTPLAWLRQPATTNSPSAILTTLDRLGWLKRWGVEAWDVTCLTPNRLKFLAQLARKATPHMLQRVPEPRRYPMLVAFLAQSLVDLTDAVIEMFDQCLADTDRRARQDLDEFRSTVARATNEKVWLFRELGRVVLDPAIRDPELRAAIYQRIPPDVLRRAVEESEQIVRPLDDNYFDFLERRYGYLRQCAPRFLETLTFRTHATPDPLLEAVDLLQRLNAEHRRAVPPDAPIAFVPPKWRPSVLDRQGRIDRHAYELCILWALRGALRAGDVWVASSRRYANPDTYLIPIDRWPALRAEVCRQLQLPAEGTTRLAARAAELEALLPRIDQLLAHDGSVRMEQGHLVVSPLEAADRPASVERLEQQIDARLPRIDLSDVLIEVDRWTRFSQHFTHAGGRASRTTEWPRQFYAAVLAQGCNISLTTMAQSAELSYDQLAWCTTWYLREETLKAAVSALVNFHYHQPLSHHWGGGTLSSSDGQRVPVAGKIRNATALPRYFGYGKGVTFYTCNCSTRVE
jgi:uncharacterized protein DUF4158/Tn3 transposase DDE domain-containing protein